jgi:hypothetical protein
MITMLISDPLRDAPVPFRNDDNGWLLPPDVPIGADPDQLAPLPALVTVGGRAGQHVLLDLEYLRMLGIGGDLREATNLLRFIVVELCHAIWADDVRVTIAGFASDAPTLATIDPDRIRVRSTTIGAIDEFHRQLDHAIATPDDVRTPEVLVIARPNPSDMQALAALERDLMTAPGVGMSVVTGPTPPGYTVGRYQMTVGAAGDLHIGFLGDAIVPAASLPSELLTDVASLLTAARAADAGRPLDVARAASLAARAAAPMSRPVALAGQHRQDAATGRPFRAGMTDLARGRHMRPA